MKICKYEKEAKETILELLEKLKKQQKEIEELKEKIGNAKDILEDYQNGLYTMKERKSMSDTHIEMAIYYLESEE